MVIYVHWPRTSKLIRLLTGRQNLLRKYVHKYVRPILWDDMKSTKIIIELWT